MVTKLKNSADARSKLKIIFYLLLIIVSIVVLENLIYANIPHIGKNSRKKTYRI